MRIIVIMVIISFLVFPVSALNIEAPPMPDVAEEYLDGHTESFTDGLLQILQQAVKRLQPALAEAASICFSLIVIAILTAIVRSLSVDTKGTIELVSTLTMSLLLLQPSHSLLQLGIDTMKQISEYGKLLLPTIAAAMAAQGAPTASGALYAGTAVFNTILMSLMNTILVPAIYIYISLCIAQKAIGNELILSVKNTVKWTLTWVLKTIIYIFTGYLSITGIISGSADAAAIKAAKLTISGVVPVVGNIISDASETVIVSAGVIKNTIGIGGLLAILSICVSPFIRIGIHYLLLKLTGGVCQVLSSKDTAAIVHDFSATMGLVLAMTGTVCILFLVSTVCYMKGVA